MHRFTGFLTPFRHMFVWLTLVLVTSGSAQDIGSRPNSIRPSPPPEPPVVDRVILFTGKLMGYYRLPNQQSFFRSVSDPPCSVPDRDHQESRDAKVFIENYRERSLDTLLVGTGDNFAPNYYSRVLYSETKVDPTRSQAKELYQWDRTNSKWDWYRQSSPETKAELRLGESTIPTDNVGCFLSYVHYDAVVPGKHDFYYGPERLRELARFLAKDKGEKFPPVQMLGANLMIKTAWANDHKPIPDSGKPPLPFLAKNLQIPWPQHTGKDEPYLEIADFTDNGFAFPWMRFVRINANRVWQPELRDSLKKSLIDSIKVYLCEATLGNPDDFLGRDGDCKKPPLSPPHTNELHFNEAATSAAEEDASPGTITLVYDLSKAPPLQPRHSYAVCIQPLGSTTDKRPGNNVRDARPYCFRFSVYDPFFQFPNWNNENPSDPNAHSDPKGRYKNPDLWVVRENDGKTPVVIFGVVDPQLQEHVGGDNFAWRTVRGAPESAKENNRYTTMLAIADPVLTLIHLQDYFEEAYARDHHGQGFKGIRVLLAQMSPEQVKPLAERLPKCLRFDVIITAADDGLATPNQVLQYRPTLVQEDRGCKANVGASGLKMKSQRVMTGSLATPVTFIAVPPGHGQSPALPTTQAQGDQKSRFLQARQLHITADLRPNVTYTLNGEPLPVLVPDIRRLDGLASTFWMGVCKAVYLAEECQPQPNNKAMVSRNGTPTVVPWDDDVKKAAIQQLALWSIREQYHTDIALLQNRDIYLQGLDEYLSEHCKTSRSGGREQCDLNFTLTLETQEILDRMIWKDDYIEVKSVQGSVLRTVLKRSDQFSRTEKAEYLPVSETGRPLITVGIQPDSKGGDDPKIDYLINDRPLDPNAVYTVATSDYIALGDTGYPDLAAPPVGDPRPPASASESIITISGSTCETLMRAQGFPSANCHKPLDREGYYDELTNRTPDDARPGNTSWHKLYAWTFLHGALGQPVAKSRGQTPLGADDIATQMQKRVDADKNWDFSLDKASIGFSALTHTDSEQTLSGKFGGVQDATANAKHSHSWDWDANSKFTLFHKSFDGFVSEGLQYSSSFTSNISGPRSETQPRNKFALDFGAYLHWWAKDKQLPKWSWVTEGHFETQVANPLTNIGLDAVSPSTTPSTLSFQQGRTRLLLGRTGTRFEDRKSYIEAGLEGGKNLNAIDQFRVLTTPGGPVVTCLLQATISLTKCLNTFNQNNPLTPVTPSSIVDVIRRPQPRYGVYWNIGLTVPVNPTISYNFQDSSDYFLNSSGDNSADTRFRHQLVNSLKFAVFPNLSFEPTYTIFLYENKVDYHFLVQQQYTVKINYSFDWSNWHESRQQLRYKKPSPQ